MAPVMIHSAHHRLIAGALITLALFLCNLFNANAQDKEVKLKKKDLPKNVVAAFAKAYPKATITGTSKEIEKGITYFEIESVDGKAHRDLLYSADGIVHETEETIDAAGLPAKATQALAKDYAGANVVKAEKITADGKSGYEVTIRINGKTKELAFDVDGNVKSRAKEEMKNGNSKKDDDDDEDDD